MSDPRISRYTKLSGASKHIPLRSRRAYAKSARFNLTEINGKVKELRQAFRDGDYRHCITLSKQIEDLNNSMRSYLKKLLGKQA